MLCPYLTKEILHYATEDRPVPADCLREECAWWAPVGDTCFVPELSRSLRRLSNQMEDLIKKLPTANKPWA